MTRRKSSRHNPIPPPWYIAPPAVLSESYQREVDRSTDKLERAYRQAEKRAQQAEARLDRARNREAKGRLIAELEAQVRARLDELEEYRRMMQHATATKRKAVHRTGRDDRLETGTWK